MAYYRIIKNAGIQAILQNGKTTLYTAGHPLTVMQNAEETFVRMDKKLADAFAHITGTDIPDPGQTLNIAPVVGETAHIINALHNDN